MEENQLSKEQFESAADAVVQPEVAAQRRREAIRQVEEAKKIVHKKRIRITFAFTLLGAAGDGVAMWLTGSSLGGGLFLSTVIGGFLGSALAAWRYRLGRT